jgi:hypothetical protein
LVSQRDYEVFRPFSARRRPPSLRQHLFDRVADRQISAEDLYTLKLWRASDPEAPDGSWYKDFGSFKICGKGPFPKTFLLKDSRRRGRLSK